MLVLFCFHFIVCGNKSDTRRCLSSSTLLDFIVMSQWSRCYSPLIREISSLMEEYKETNKHLCICLTGAIFIHDNLWKKLLFHCQHTQNFPLLWSKGDTECVHVCASVCVLTGSGKDQYICMLLLHEHMSETFLSGGNETGPFWGHTRVKQGSVITPIFCSIFVSALLHFGGKNPPEEVWIMLEDWWSASHHQHVQG